MSTAIETLQEHRAFGGVMGFYAHSSSSTGTTMRFGVFVPGGAASSRPPAVYFLAGLACTEETFFIKAGALAYATEFGLALVACDTSPRGLDLPGETESWDVGAGAGFYLDATVEPWSAHYRMGSYVNDELPALVEQHFPVAGARRGITGHSMAGNGALVIALRNPDRWHSVSAIAPICNPSEVPWGQKAFSNYLGPRSAAWKDWDASELMRRRPHPTTILVDQGTTDQFLDTQLRPEALEAAAAASGQALRLNRHDNYDHSYWFIQTVIHGHLSHHARALHGPGRRN